jgi:hypothetical protein
MFDVNDRVRINKENSKYFGRVGTITRERANNERSVKFGGRGRPSTFKIEDLELVVERPLPAGDYGIQD